VDELEQGAEAVIKLIAGTHDPLIPA
jgi:hypothetical protein